MKSLREVRFACNRYSLLLNVLNASVFGYVLNAFSAFLVCENETNPGFYFQVCMMSMAMYILPKLCGLVLSHITLCKQYPWITLWVLCMLLRI